MDINNMRFICDNLHYKTMTGLSYEQIHYLDLTCVFSGDALYRYNGQEVHVRSGDMIIYPQWSWRERFPTTEQVHYNSINVHFKGEFTSAITGHHPGIVTAEVRQTMEQIHAIWQGTAENRELQCLSLFSYLYYHLLETVQRRQNPYIQGVKEYVTLHLTEAMALEDIAAYVRLSPEYCCALFKKETGMTIFSYLTMQRMDFAKRLILLGYPLSEVAEQVGYTDYNYFSRTFKKCTGMTPLVYKKTM